MGILLTILQKLKHMVREYCEQLYTNKVENLDEIHKFQRHKQLKIQEDIEKP